MTPTARGLAWFAILFVLTSGLIGAYQTGMEYHLLPGPAACSGHRYVLGSGAPPPEVQCDVVAWSIVRHFDGVMERAFALS